MKEVLFNLLDIQPSGGIKRISNIVNKEKTRYRS